MMVMMMVVEVVLVRMLMMLIIMIPMIDNNEEEDTIDVYDQTTTGNLVSEETPHSNMALPEHIFRMWMYLCTSDVPLRGCTSGGVYVPCIYTHAR